MGVVQEIDAAAMSLWLSYRHLSYDDGLTSEALAAGVPLPGHSIDTHTGYDSFQYIKFGGLINF